MLNYTQNPRSFTYVYINKNIDSETFGNAESPSNPEDLNIQDAATKYDDVILYLRNEISRLRKFIGFDKIDTATEDGEDVTGKYLLNAESDYLFVFGYKQGIDLTTKDKMTCLLDYIKQFARIVKIYEGILSPEETTINFDNLDEIQ